jgi:ribosomal protein L7/L12
MSDSAELAALRIRVADLERKLDYVMRRLNVPDPDTPQASVLAEAEQWLRQGKKIEAVKAYRERTGVGLKEAKDVVDDLERRLSGRP